MRSFRNLPAGRSPAAWLGALLLLLALSGWVPGGGTATGGGPHAAPFDAAGGPGARGARADAAGFATMAVSTGAIALVTAGLLAGWPVRASVATGPQPRRAAPFAAVPPRRRTLPRGPPGTT